MFERFTDRFCRVLVGAQAEARRLHHDAIGTERILLGLAAEADGVAGVVLASFGLTVDRIRAEVENGVPPVATGPGDAEVLATIGIDLARVKAAIEGTFGEGSLATEPSPPFTPRGKWLLEQAFLASLGLGHAYIGTEHLLLAMTVSPDGVGPAILAAAAPAPAVRFAVCLRLAAFDPSVPEADAATVATAAWLALDHAHLPTLERLTTAALRSALDAHGLRGGQSGDLRQHPSVAEVRAALGDDEVGAELRRRLDADLDAARTTAVASAESVRAAVRVALDGQPGR